jgi:hypothetical protein
MILKALIGVAAVALVFAFFVSRQPSAFHIERSITIDAAPARAFAHVNDFRAWAAWSPYEKLDPEMMRLFGGSASGEGASYTWAGNGQVGEGRMTIERSVPSASIDIRLEFSKPFVSQSRARFSFDPTPEGTRVTWAMDGHNNLIARAMHVFMDIDTMISSQFDAGLTQLKALAESTTRTPSAAL